MCTRVVAPGPTELPEKPPVIVTYACLPQVVSRMTFYGNSGPTGLVFASNSLVVIDVINETGADDEMLVRFLLLLFNYFCAHKTY